MTPLPPESVLPFLPGAPLVKLYLSRIHVCSCIVHTYRVDKYMRVFICHTIIIYG